MPATIGQHTDDALSKFAAQVYGPNSAIPAMSELVAAIIEDNPDATAADVRDLLAELNAGHAVAMEQLTRQAICRNCGAPITTFADSPWRHMDVDRSRGCRAATFDSETGWDDSIDRRFNAEPPKKRR